MVQNSAVLPHDETPKLAAAGQVVVLAAAGVLVEVAPHGAERLPSHLAPDAAA